MDYSLKTKKDTENKSEEYITEEERKELLSALHCRLFWVGQQIPDYIEFDGKNYPLHNYVWELIQKDKLTDEDKSRIDKCIEKISAKEKKMKKTWKKNLLLMKMLRLFIMRLQDCYVQLWI